MNGPSPKKVLIGLVQMACCDEKEANLTCALEMITEAADHGAGLVCLPELFSGLYPCQTESHDQFSAAESIPGPTCERLAEAARRHHVVLIGSLFERRAPGLFHNTAVVFENDGRLLGCYRKIHIPDDPSYYEKFYFAPGDLGFPVFETSIGKIGVAVCWDQWFPEAARLLALGGAELILFPTAIGWLNEEKEHWGQSQWSAWQTMMRAHAIANGLFVAAVNRVGTEESIEFWGRSFCSNPYGEVLVGDDGQQQPGVLYAECDLALIETARTHWPFLRDRRPDVYHDLTRQFLR